MGFFALERALWPFFSRNLGVQIIPFKLKKKNLNMVIGRKRDMAKSVNEALTWGCKSQS